VTAGGLHAGYRVVFTAVEHEHNPWRDWQDEGGEG